MLVGTYDLREQAAVLSLGGAGDSFGQVPYIAYVRALDQAEGREPRDLNGWKGGAVQLDAFDEAASVLAGTVGTVVGRYGELRPLAERLYRAV